jgi:hypothetical protein
VPSWSSDGYVQELPIEIEGDRNFFETVIIDFVLNKNT